MNGAALVEAAARRMVTYLPGPSVHRAAFAASKDARDAADILAPFTAVVRDRTLSSGATIVALTELQRLVEYRFGGPLLASIVDAALRCEYTHEVDSNEIFSVTFMQLSVLTTCLGADPAAALISDELYERIFRFVAVHAADPSASLLMEQVLRRAFVVVGRHAGARSAEMCDLVLQICARMLDPQSTRVQAVARVSVLEVMCALMLEPPKPIDPGTQVYVRGILRYVQTSPNAGLVVSARRAAELFDEYTK